MKKTEDSARRHRELPNTAEAMVSSEALLVGCILVAAGLVLTFTLMFAALGGAS